MRTVYQVAREAISWVAGDIQQNPTKVLPGIATPACWQRFYRWYFPDLYKRSGGPRAFTELPLPRAEDDFDACIVVLAGLTLDSMYEALAYYAHAFGFGFDGGGMLLEDRVDNMRTSKRTYAVRIRSRIDGEPANISAAQALLMNLSGMTLLERLLLELKYWSLTRRYLVDLHPTLCTGSRDSVNVPVVFKHGGRCCVDGVDWVNLQHPRYAVREVRAMSAFA